MTGVDSYLASLVAVGIAVAASIVNCQGHRVRPDGFDGSAEDKPTSFDPSDNHETEAGR